MTSPPRFAPHFRSHAESGISFLQAFSRIPDAAPSVHPQRGARRLVLPNIVAKATHRHSERIGRPFPRSALRNARPRSRGIPQPVLVCPSSFRRPVPIPAPTRRKIGTYRPSPRPTPHRRHSELPEREAPGKGSFRGKQAPLRLRVGSPDPIPCQSARGKRYCARPAPISSDPGSIRSNDVCVFSKGQLPQSERPATSQSERKLQIVSVVSPTGKPSAGLVAQMCQTVRTLAVLV